MGSIWSFPFFSVDDDCDFDLIVFCSQRDGTTQMELQLELKLEFTEFRWQCGWWFVVARSNHSLKDTITNSLSNTEAFLIATVTVVIDVVIIVVVVLLQIDIITIIILMKLAI